MKKILAAAIAVSLTFSALAVPAAAWDELIPTSSEESFEEVSLDSAEDAVTDLDSSSEESTDSATDTDGEYSAVTDLDSATDADSEAEADPQIADESAADITVMGKQSKEYDNITYTVLKDGTLRIDEFIPDEKAEEVTIPAEIDGKKVTKIGDRAFDSEHIKNVYNIEVNNIKKVVIPEGITHIGDFNFNNLKKLTSLSLPNSLLKIGCCFSKCDNLKSVKLPEKLKVIDSFSNTGLISITIPASVTSIGPDSFYHTPNLKEINVNKANKKYASKDGILYNKAMTRLIMSPAKKTNVNIPDGVKEIYHYAFAYTNIKKVKLPSTVAKIDTYAFAWAPNLESINIPSKVKELPLGIFHATYNLKNITLPEGLTTIGAEAFFGCSSLTNITLPKSLKTIESGAFDWAKKLEKVYYRGSKAQWKKVSGTKYMGTPKIYYNWNNSSKNLKDATISLSIDDYDSEYFGKAITPAVKVNIGSKVLKNGRDYTLKYSNNKKIGKATITIKGKGVYSGTIKKTFKIVPAKQEITDMNFDDFCTITWKMDKYADGYQVRYNSSAPYYYSGGKTIKIDNNATNFFAFTPKLLKNNKTYYLFVRSYKTVNGKTYYGDWSDYWWVTTD